MCILNYDAYSRVHIYIIYELVQVILVIYARMHITILRATIKSMCTNILLVLVRSMYSGWGKLKRARPVCVLHDVMTSPEEMFPQRGASPLPGGVSTVRLRHVLLIPWDIPGKFQCDISS